MTVLLYLEDPCLRSFRAKVTSLEGEWVQLDRTAFYPGGGGQESDTGTIDGLRVTEMRKGDVVAHRVPGHSFQEGQEVVGDLDWKRRLDLMRGHTGEHMLFSAISNRVEGAELVKISIAPERKAFVVNGNLDWEIVSSVQAEVNGAILSDMGVEAEWALRDDPGLEGIRAKLERIPGDMVRVVRIGDYDAAACAGVHVPSTGHIGAVLVTRMTSARPAGSVEVEFEVGPRAMAKALELATISLEASEAMGAHPEHLVRALENLRAEADRGKSALRRYGRMALESLVPEELGGMLIYSGIFPGIDRKLVISAASDIVAEPGRACALIALDEGVMLVVARSKGLDLDCREVLRLALAPVGGRGGGRPEFATGGSSQVEDLDGIRARAIEAMRE